MAGCEVMDMEIKSVSYGCCDYKLAMRVPAKGS